VSFAGEIAQWAVLAGLAFLILGLYRQLGVFLNNSGHSAENLSGPALRKRAPDSLYEAVRDSNSTALDTIVAFVSERCQSCSFLLAEIGRADVTDALGERGFRIVLVARESSPSFIQALRDTGIPLVVDDGTIWSQCNIQFTPFLVRLDEDGRVLQKAVTHDIDHAFV